MNDGIDNGLGNIIYLDTVFPGGLTRIYTLAFLTSLYFRIAYTYRHSNKVTYDIPTYVALADLNTILKNVSDTRPLWHATAQLQWDIINGNSTDDSEEMRHGA